QVGGLKSLRNALPNARPGPAIEPLKHRIPKAETFRQVAPRSPGPSNPDHRVDKQPVVFGTPAGITFPTWEQMLDLPPLYIREFVASHGTASLLARIGSGQGRSVYHETAESNKMTVNTT